MYAVVIPVSFNDRAAAQDELAQLVPQVSGIPGFIAGYWVALSDDEGTAMMVFESEDGANAVAAQAKAAPAAAVTTLSVAVGEVMAHA